MEHDRRNCGYRDSEAQIRLQKLEEMVTSLIQTNKEGSESRSDKTSHDGTSDHILDNASIHSSPQISDLSSRGYLSMNVPEKEYVNATHWTAILENVRSHLPRRSLQPPADVVRFETSKVSWSTSPMTART